MPKAVALFSGGLDSQLAVNLMLEQGVDVECLTVVSVFHQAAAGPEHPAARAAARLGVPITLVDLNDEMLAMVKNPRFGRGKNMNPCVDCRILLLRRAADRMRETGANFIVTGEVLGQRPMSQRRDAIRRIEREAGVEGYVLRPLSARLLNPTVPETEGLVDREKLLAIRGRSRREQMALAETLGITDYPSPAGGCLLTDPGFAFRLRDLLERRDACLHDVELLRVGRHFRLDDCTKLVMGRHEAENARLEALAQPGDRLLDAADVTGPTALLRGDTREANVETAAQLTLKYGKAKDEAAARVTVRKAGTDESSDVTVAPATDDEVKRLLITKRPAAEGQR